LGSIKIRLPIQYKPYDSILIFFLVDETVDLDKWMGCQPGGWAYGSRGCICHDSAVSSEGVGDYSNLYGEKCSTGDIIGVLVNLVDSSNPESNTVSF
jgi:hypothetical protein